jgi:hypothetical protein
MVLRGQDAWRKHPLMSGLWKKPFPHLGLAVGLFATYCTGEYLLNHFTSPPPAVHTKPRFKINESGIDTMPNSSKIGGDHH